MAAIAACALVLGCNHAGAKLGVATGGTIAGVGGAFALAADDQETTDNASVAIVAGLVLAVPSLLVFLSTSDPVPSEAHRPRRRVPSPTAAD